MTTQENISNLLDIIQHNYDIIINNLYNNKDETKSKIIDYLDNQFPDLTHEIRKLNQFINKIK